MHAYRKKKSTKFAHIKKKQYLCTAFQFTNVIHTCLIYILQIMITSQTFIQKNTGKYRAKVDFIRIYDAERHEWLHYYNHEKKQYLGQFLNSIENTIGKTLRTSLMLMSYELYSFYYYADNIKVRKEGDRITIFYNAIRK